MALPRNIQLLRFCRTRGAACGARSLGLWEVVIRGSREMLHGDM